MYKPKIDKSLIKMIHQDPLFVEGWGAVCEGNVYIYGKRKAGGWKFYKISKRDPRYNYFILEDWYFTVGRTLMDKARAIRKKVTKKK